MRNDSDPAPVQPPVTDPRFDHGELIGSPAVLQRRAKLQTGAPARGQRFDDWRNVFTGQGVPGRDKRMGGHFAPASLSFDQLRDLYLGDDLAAVVVDKIPSEAKRPGYDITIADSGENDQEGHDLCAEITARLHDLGADTHLEQAGKYARAYGGGAILLGANDKQTDLTQELKLDNVHSLDWLTTLEARECIPVYAYGNPAAPNYGKPEIYRLTSRTVLPSRNGSYGVTTQDIHESRLIVMDGYRVSRYQATAMRAGWGESVLTRVWRLLRDFNTAWSAAGVLVTDFAQTVIKMTGLWASLSDGGKDFEDRLAAMEYGRSTINAITIDGADSWERQPTPLNGLPDLLEKFAVRLAAACGMPLTLLFGTSPAGMNATGESDIRFFYDRVDEYRQAHLQPALRRLIQILFRTIGNKKEPPKWSLEFRPLWQESTKDTSAAMLAQAQADTAWVNIGSLTPEEVTKSHWGQGKFNPHITIDHDARDEQTAATEGEPSAEDLAAMGRDPASAAPTAPNGAQLASMMEIVKAAVAGQIPRESAQTLLQVAIPTLSPQQAIALLGPATFVPTPEVAPVKAAPVTPPVGGAELPRADGDDTTSRTKKDLLRRLAPSGKCATCGQTGHKLEVDHVNGRNWAPRELSKTQRAAKYWDEYDRGTKLRALCRSCNGSDGAKNKQEHPRADEDGDWEESLHPRAEDGKFGSGGGSGGDGQARHAAYMAEIRAKVSGGAASRSGTSKRSGTGTQGVKAGKAAPSTSSATSRKPSSSVATKAAPAATKSSAGKTTIAQGLKQGSAGAAFAPKAQRAIYDEHTALVQQQGIKENKHAMGSGTGAGTVEVKSIDEMGGAGARVNLDTGGLELHTEAAAWRAEHASQDPKALGARYQDDAHARDLVGAHHLITHETLHNSGPLVEFSGLGLMAEEMTTEMAARSVTSELHGIPSHTLYGAYNKFITPTTERISALTGADSNKSFAALAHASLEHKRGTPTATEMPGADVLHNVATSALKQLGITDHAAVSDLVQTMVDTAHAHPPFAKRR